MAAGRCVFYGFVAYSVLSYAAGEKGSGSGSSDKDAQDIKVLDWPAGQWIVGIAGAAVPVLVHRSLSGRSRTSSRST